MGVLWRFLLCFIALTGLSVDSQQTLDDDSPFVQAARTLLKEHMQGPRGDAGNGAFGAVGALLQSFMQSGGGRQLAEMFKDGDLLSSIGSALASSVGKEELGNSPHSPAIDPQLIADLVGAFTSSHSDENNNEVTQGRGRQERVHRQQPQQQEMDWSGMLDVVTTLVGSQQQGAGSGALEGLINLMPMLLKAGGSTGSGRAAEGESGELSVGAGKPSVFAPILTAIRDYWTHFTNSEFGQTLWKTSGLEATLKLFTDGKGNLDTERIYRSLENASFRKRWVRSLAMYISDWIAHVSDPDTQQRYLITAQFMGNGFLKAQGYPKSVMFDPARPSESLSRLVNAVFKKQFGLKIESGTYIKPAVTYLQEVFELGRAKGLSLSHLSPKEIEDKLTDTISGQMIEPAMRVWRAYWYATRHPQCDQYVICTVNQRNVSIEGGLKPGVTKLSSMVAIWFLSGNTGTSFWKLYNAAVEDNNCQIQYPVDCTTFHEEDVKATTEYIHSEL